MIKSGMRPVHPGEVLLADYIKPLGMSVNALAKALDVPRSRINAIVKTQRGVSADTALRLERYFGGDAQGWLNMQAVYDLKIAQKMNGKAIMKAIMPHAMAASVCFENPAL